MGEEAGWRNAEQKKRYLHKNAKTFFYYSHTHTHTHTRICKILREYPPALHRGERRFMITSGFSSSFLYSTNKFGGAGGSNKPNKRAGDPACSCQSSHNTLSPYPPQHQPTTPPQMSYVCITHERKRSEPAAISVGWGKEEKREDDEIHMLLATPFTYPHHHRRKKKSWFVS